jgi:hypothetical protein
MDSLIGKEAELFGVCDKVFKIQLVGEATPMFLEAMEDDSDGYRSSLDRVIVHPTQPASTTLPSTSIGRVTIVKSSGIDGWDFVDRNQHAWLSIGTDCSDSYYPCFIFRWELPPAPNIIPDKTPRKRTKPYDPFDL